MELPADFLSQGRGSVRYSGGKQSDLAKHNPEPESIYAAKGPVL